MKTLMQGAVRAAGGFAVLAVLAGCGTLSLGRGRDAVVPASSALQAAGPLNPPATRSRTEQELPEPAGIATSPLGERVATAARCGLKGAAQPLRLLLVPVGGLIALPLIPVGAVLGTVEGAYNGWCH